MENIGLIKFPSSCVRPNILWAIVFRGKARTFYRYNKYLLKCVFDWRLSTFLLPIACLMKVIFRSCKNAESDITHMQNLLEKAPIDQFFYLRLPSYSPLSSYNNWMWKIIIVSTSIKSQDLNLQLLDRESPPITTRPRFLPNSFNCLKHSGVKDNSFQTGAGSFKLRWDHFGNTIIGLSGYPFELLFKHFFYG